MTGPLRGRLFWSLGAAAELRRAVTIAVRDAGATVTAASRD